MNVGKLNRRIKVVRQLPSRDEAGGTYSVLGEMLETWANVKPMDGQRALQFAQITHEYPYEITMRYRPNFEVLSTDLLVFDNKRFVIHSIIVRESEQKELNIIAWQDRRNIEGEIIKPQFYEDGSIQVYEG